MTIREAIEDALTFIETQHGHKDGDVYQNLAGALKELDTHENSARILETSF